MTNCQASLRRPVFVILGLAWLTTGFSKSGQYVGHNLLGNAAEAGQVVRAPESWTMSYLRNGSYVLVPQGTSRIRNMLANLTGRKRFQRPEKSNLDDLRRDSP